MSNGTLGVYWFTLDKHTNFGDELGPEILRRLGYKVRYAEAKNADLVSIGSILEYIDQVGRKNMMVWGSGLISQHGTCAKDLDYRAVRGHLTAQRLGLPADIVLGDPGLLTSRLWIGNKIRRGVGIVPHYVDNRRFLWADKVIDVRNPVNEVISEITSCSAIISSSLHGLVVAQSFGIPAMRYPHPEVVGKDWKWLDYQSAFDDDLHNIQNRLVQVLP